MEVDDAEGRRPRGGFGSALADLFRELGYDEGDLHADMFEWLFGLPSLRVQAFLDWFLASVRARQSVKRQLGGAREYAIYKTLLTRRGGLLTGEQLARAEMACESERAMQRHGGGAESDESLDALARANAALEREVAAMETKLRLANERNERLARLAQRRGAVTDQQTQRLRRQQDREQYSEILAQIAPGNKRSPAGKAPTPDELVGRIRATLRHLATPAPSVSGDALIPSAQHRSSSMSSLVARTPTKSLTRENPASSALSLRDEARKWRDFLYQHSMEPLQAQEEANLRSLQAKIPAISALRSTLSVQSGGDTSHEPNGSSDVAMSPAPTATRRGNDVPSPWLHESDPTQLNMRDQDTLLYNKCCVELDRLRKAFVVGKQDALLAQLQVTRYESQLRQLTSSRRQLLQQFQLMSRDAIWARKQILQASVDKTKKQLGELFQRALPEKLDELAFLKSTSILLHSYEQKLWRQENRFVKLRLLLDGFEMQHARLRLVHCLLDAERQDLLQIDNIFQKLVATVRDHNQSAEKRIHSYDMTSGSDAARNTLAQTYLHEQDDVAHRLFEALERRVHEGEQQQAMTHAVHLRTFDDLVRLGEEKCSKEQTLEETSARLYHEFKRLYDSKRFTLDQLRRELFGDATSSTPMLMPVELETTLRQATETKDAAEIGLEKALETLRLHRRSVQVDPSKRMQQERDIARLRHDLQERL